MCTDTFHSNRRSKTGLYTSLPLTVIASVHRVGQFTTCARVYVCGECEFVCVLFASLTKTRKTLCVFLLYYKLLRPPNGLFCASLHRAKFFWFSLLNCNVRFVIHRSFSPGWLKGHMSIMCWCNLITQSCMCACFVLFCFVLFFCFFKPCFPQS